MTATVFGVVSLGCLTLMAVPAWADARHSPVAVTLVLVLFAAAQVLSVLDLAAHGRERARFLPGVLALSLSALSVASEALGPSPGTTSWWPLTILTTLGIYLVAVTYASGVGWAATLLASGGVLLAVFVTVPIDAEEQLRRGLSQLVVLAGILATTDLWARGLRAVALEADRIEAQRLADLRTTSAAGREAVRLRDVERYIHDEVLHTLRAIAMDRADLPKAKVVPWAQRLSRELSATALHERVDPPAPTSADPGPRAPTSADPGPRAPDATGPAYTDLVARLVALEFPLDVTWRMPRSVSLPTQVSEALVAAVSEALRNVVRHAGVPEASVDVRATTTAVEVVVRDEGVGFDPRETRLTRHGVARSVVERMTDVGGTARVESAPGRGATVTLRWEPSVPRVGGRTFPWNDTTVRDVVVRFTLVLLPSLAAAGVLTLLTLPLTERPLLALAGLAAIVFAAVHVPRVTTPQGMGPVVAALLQLLTVGTVLAIGMSVEKGSADPAELGALPYAALIPMVLLFTRPLWEGVLAWALLTVTSAFVCLFHAGGPEDLVALWGIVVSPGVAMTAAIALRFALDRFGQATFLAVDARARAQGEAQRTRVVREQVALRLDRVNTAARSFLDDIAAGRLDVADDGVRARADELERAVREDLSLGPAPGVRAAVAALRARGVQVEMRVPPHPPEPVDTAVGDLVGALLEVTPARAGQAGRPGDPGEAREPGVNPLTSAPTPTMRREDTLVRRVALTLTPREDVWTVALLAHSTQEGAAALATTWRAALAGVDASVMAIDADVRVRTQVAVPSPAPRP